MTMRHGRDQSFAARRATARPGHVGLGPALIDEHQLGRAQIGLFVPPFGARLGNVRAILFGRVERLFLLSARVPPASCTSDRRSPKPGASLTTRPATRRSLHPGGPSPAPQSRHANRSAWAADDSVAATPLSAPCAVVATTPWRRRIHSRATKPRSARPARRHLPRREPAPVDPANRPSHAAKAYRHSGSFNRRPTNRTWRAIRTRYFCMAAIPVSMNVL